MTELLSKLWDKIFHVDNKFLRMSWHLLIPARVTIAYFKGHIKRYPHPIQFFFICIFLLLVYINQVSNKSPSFNLFDILEDENIYTIKGRVDYYDELQHQWDSIPGSLRTDSSRMAFDSVLERTSQTIRYFRNDSLNTEGFYFLTRSYKIANHDWLHLQTDSLFERYEVHAYWDRLAIGQSLKTLREPESMGRFWMSAIAWTLLCQIFAMSCWLKLLYWRQHRYLVEHFVFMIHLHSGFILLLIFFSFLRKIVGLSFITEKLPVFWFLGALLLGMYWFYRQSKRKTILKWLIFMALYTITLLTIFIMSFAATFLFF